MSILIFQVQLLRHKEIRTQVVWLPSLLHWVPNFSVLKDHDILVKNTGILDQKSDSAAGGLQTTLSWSQFYQL